MARAAVATSRSTTRQSLIDAAHALIWANSYAHVSVEDICRAAGVLKGSFYHFFPTKNDLAAAAIEDHWQLVKPKMDAIFAAGLSPQEQLTALCAAVLDQQQQALDASGTVCGCPYATIAAELSNSNEALRTLSADISDRFFAYYEQLMHNIAAIGVIPSHEAMRRANEMHVYTIGAMFHARNTNRLDSVGDSLKAALFRISGLEAR